MKNQEAKEYKAFLDAIAAKPRDVDMRRIFADWLDDHDEPEAADEQRRFSVAQYDAEKAEETERIVRENAESFGYYRDDYERCAC